MIVLTLKAIGGAMSDAVGLENGPDPVPGPGELLVASEAAPINPGDVLLAAGLYVFQPRLPFALGTEGVRRVLAAGPAPTRVRWVGEC
jgi:NADPH2:quinone reductase